MQLVRIYLPGFYCKTGKPKHCFKGLDTHQIFRIMKLTALLLTVAFINVKAIGLSQTVTLSCKDMPLEKVCNLIKQQTGYLFFCNDEVWEISKPVTLRVRNIKIDEVLTLVMKDQPLDYTIENKTVVISKRRKVITSSDVNNSNPFIDVRGKVLNEKGEPVEGVTVTVKGGKQVTATNLNGEFSLSTVDENAILVFSSVNMETFELKVSGKSELLVNLKTKVSGLGEVTVLSTGYQTISPERATGSFSQIDNVLLNRKVSTNILDRLDGVTSGLIFNVNRNVAANEPLISIRGRSTIFSNANPLVVIDNFPYDGDLSTINPNDVESVTILKDAAASSIWGAFSGNGVIVITTKKGKYNQPLKVALNCNVTKGNKPDLNYQPRLSSSDYIDVETFLFDKNFYNSQITNSNRPALSPVVEILIKKRNGIISTSDAETQLNLLREQDIRTDLEKYFYRSSLNQQYSLSLNGGSNFNQYNFSVGLDKNLDNLKGNAINRITLSGTNTYALINKRLELTTSLVFTKNKINNNGISNIGVNYPYLKLVNPDGSAASIARDYRQLYIDTAGAGKLLDWNYRPLDELNNANDIAKLTEIRVNVGVKYRLLKSLSFAAYYQFNNGINERRNLQNQQAYFTRDLINKFTQINRQLGTITQPVPLGSIIDIFNDNFKSNNLRGLLSYNKSITNEHNITAIAGAEVRELISNQNANRLYGYNEDMETDVRVNYFIDYPLYYRNITNRIPDPYTTRRFKGSDKYISYFSNLAYTYLNRYTVSASARKDKSNLFGVATNKKGVPLWSIGAAWNLDQEKFYKVSWLPSLKLRITNGYNGNVNKNTAALITVNAGVPNVYNAPIFVVLNPPNDSLRWERINMLNVGIDFSIKNLVLTGSIEYYHKKSKDLIGSSPFDPTTGVTVFTGNTADMVGNGVDVNLNSNVRLSSFLWQANFLFSYAADKITTYKLKPGTIGTFWSTSINPIEGRPLYSIHSYRWAGLDASGNPSAYLDDKISTPADYSKFLTSANLENLKYNGPARPIMFGSLRNTFSWKQLSLSIMLTYKLGYYFVKPSIDYFSLFNKGIGSPDYTLRWQTSGDENVTNVPSIIYPANSTRDLIYAKSDINVEKGDHIRLQDIQLSYDFQKTQFHKLPLNNLKIYAFINNVGILWKATKTSFDPDYITTSFAPITFSFGIQTSLY